MKNIIIDSHTHVYPSLTHMVDRLTKFSPETHSKMVLATFGAEKALEQVKKPLRKLTAPISNLLHKGQLLSRELPAGIRPLLEMYAVPWIGGLSTLEFGPDDLRAQMEKCGVSKSVIIAHPPLIPNDFILDLALEDDRFIPVVNLHGHEKPAQTFESYLERGARALKLHPASDGHGPKDPEYLELLEVANAKQIPVIIHTGCIHIRPIYKDPSLGHAEKFESWFQDFKDTKFVLAHMNYHYADQAMELAKKYEHVHLETSWQSETSIAKACATVGSHKIMYGSDWPILGNNMEVHLKRIEHLHQQRKINTTEYENLVFKTANEFFELGL